MTVARRRPNSTPLSTRPSERGWRSFATIASWPRLHPAPRRSPRHSVATLCRMSEIRTAPSNGITIAYETFGDPGAVPILLVLGLGTQMIAWRDGFCALLAERGHYVTRFDK